MRYALSALTLIAAFAACSKSSSGTGSADAYTVEANPQSALGPYTAINANTNTWTWVPAPDAFCANGNTTGFGLNLVANSNQLLIVYEGGGACFSELSCYVEGTASYMSTGYGASEFQTESASFDQLFVLNRQDPNNPFAAMNIAYIPYCTGDIHDGNQVVTYSGMKTSTHHVGYRNGQVFTRMLQATLPNVDHVWVSGFSAGGFGAVFHYPDTQTAFPNAQVDLIDDSGSAFPGFSGFPSWGEVLPTCSTCDSNNFATYVQAYSAANPNSRFAFLSYTQDSVLPLYFNITTNQFTQDLNTYATTLSALPNAKYFFVDGSGHVLLQNEGLSIDGEGITTWLQQMVSNANTWANY